MEKWREEGWMCHPQRERPGAQCPASAPWGDQRGCLGHRGWSETFLELRASSSGQGRSGSGTGTGESAARERGGWLELRLGCGQKGHFVSQTYFQIRLEAATKQKGRGQALWRL